MDETGGRGCVDVDLNTSSERATQDRFWFKAYTAFWDVPKIRVPSFCTRKYYELAQATGTGTKSPSPIVDRSVGDSALASTRYQHLSQLIRSHSFFMDIKYYIRSFFA